MSKWKYEAIIGFIGLCLMGGSWWFISTKPARKAEAEYQKLLKFANRQAVEIAVIKQAAVLQQLTNSLKAKENVSNKSPNLQPRAPEIGRIPGDGNDRGL